MHRKSWRGIGKGFWISAESHGNRGDELRITAGRQESPGKFRVEIILTMLTAAPIDIDKDLLCEPFAHFPWGHGAKIALEVLRRHHGEVSFRRDSDCQCAITFRMLASPQ